MNYGSLFTGIRGLDLAIEHHYGAEPAWVCENDPAVAAWLEQTTGLPNLGDITKVRWEDVPRVDIICGGYPCQPFSHAGQRQGTDDHRHLWPCFADAVRHLRPRLVVLENVAGHLSMGFGDVLADLAAMGFDARWGCVRAADTGAPHRRLRLFAVAHTTDERHERAGSTRRRRNGPENDGNASPDTDGERTGRDSGTVHRTNPSSRSQSVGADQPGMDRGPSADAASERRAGAVKPRADMEFDRLLTTHLGEGTWGRYLQAIRRWEHLTCQPAPTPTLGGRLNPDLPRWMMGYPPGWLDGMTRTQQLRATGNAVCPQQAILALDLLAMT